MADWLRVRLEDLALKEKSAISKPYGSAIVKEDYRIDGIPVVRGVNLGGGGRFHDDDFVYICHELADRMPGASLQPGDLVFTHRGTVGQVSMIPRQPRYARYTLSTSQVKARLDPNHAVAEFYYYWFRSKAGQRSILDHISTVGVPGLAQPVATIKALQVPKPALRVQHAIAEILGALDDKISKNDDLGTAAFELAEGIFRQQIHAISCQMRPVADVATTALGGTPDRSQADFWNGSIPWVNSGKANDRHVLIPSEYITRTGFDKSATKLAPSGSTLIAITGATMGKMARLEIEACVNQSIVAVWTADSLTNAWIHLALHSRKDALREHATGAAQQHVSKKDVDSLLIPIAHATDLGRAAVDVLALLDTSAQAERESLKLVELRDTLLPYLLSGRLHVENAKKQIEAVV